MAGFEASEISGVSTIGMDYRNDGSSNIQGNESVGDHIADDLDSYFEDINDRILISRMVSDSVMKGIVNAVSQEATEEVAAKEFEIAKLKESSRCRRVDCGGGFGASLPPRNQRGNYPSSNGLVEPNHLGETLCLLSEAAKGQLERLGKYIEDQEVPGCTYIRSGSDMMREFNSLKATVETIFHEVGVIANVDDWKLEREIRGEVEAMVFSTIFQSMQDEYDRCLLDVNGVLCLADRFKEISSIRHELGSIQKCLGCPEHRHLSLQGSQETDHFHPKSLSSHELPSGSVWDGNGKYEESKIGIPEDFETSPLKHMEAKDLYQYFRNEITKMKREHESTVQTMTEEYFSLKRQVLKDRELLKERGLFAPFRKDKDFEMLKKHISEVILKLDDILVNNEKLSEFCNHSKSRLDALLCENLQFRDLLNNQKLELSSLTLQASNTTKELSQHSVVEENLRKLVGHLESSLEDAQIEALISAEVYVCILRGTVAHANFNQEDSDMRSAIMQEVIRIIYEQALHDADITVKSDYEDSSDLESTLSQQICEIAFEEMFRDLSMELTKLREKNLKQNERLVFLESKALGVEKELQLRVEENKKLKNQVSILENSIERKDISLSEVNDAFQENQLQLELVKEELSKLTISRTELDSLISDRDKEVVLLKDQLAELQDVVGRFVIDVEKLNEKLRLSDNKLREAGEEKARFISALEQERNNLATLKVKDREHQKQMESMSRVVKVLSKSFFDFERSTTERIHWHNVRLDNSGFQLHSLVPKINNLRRTRLLYKEKLEKRCSDLQKAEAEVDVLGDEVETLLSLLEKIYVALDHYSPILQHYPGIIEILKLIKRELSGEFAKSV